MLKKEGENLKKLFQNRWPGLRLNFPKAFANKSEIVCRICPC
jgi:hypothetical protein